mmetsp:Transcript_8045/g.20748  ORF Transcript_8045/g.20748 Transcript_8045/m.20748 type:complete len:263 (-) Transcript_8045:290-1078(-)
MAPASSPPATSPPASFSPLPSIAASSDFGGFSSASVLDPVSAAAPSEAAFTSFEVCADPPSPPEPEFSPSSPSFDGPFFTRCLRLRAGSGGALRPRRMRPTAPRRVVTRRSMHSPVSTSSDRLARAPLPFSASRTCLAMTRFSRALSSTSTKLMSVPSRSLGTSELVTSEKWKNVSDIRLRHRRKPNCCFRLATCPSSRPRRFASSADSRGSESKLMSAPAFKPPSPAFFFPALVVPETSSCFARSSIATSDARRRPVRLFW